MADAQVASRYFSGQGVLLLADRSAGGAPQGFLPVGNVSALTIGLETTTFQHKESQSGARAIDLEIVQELNGSMNITFESIEKDNLALALMGSAADVASGSVTDEQLPTFHDKWAGLEHIKVSSVIVGDDAVPTTTYVLDTDYVLNEATGAIKTLSTGSIGATDVVFVDYSYADYDKIEAAETSVGATKWARFEGLNTAETNKAVVIDVYKVQVNPLAELALITDEITQMEVEARILSDALRATGSKYFTIRTED